MGAVKHATCALYGSRVGREIVDRSLKPLGVDDPPIVAQKERGDSLVLLCVTDGRALLRNFDRQDDDRKDAYISSPATVDCGTRLRPSFPASPTGAVGLATYDCSR